MEQLEVGDVAQIENVASELHGLYCEILSLESDKIGVRLIPSGRSGYSDRCYLRRIGGPSIFQSIMVQRTGRPHWSERMINDGRVEDTDLMAVIVPSLSEESHPATAIFTGDGGESGGAGASAGWEEYSRKEEEGSTSDTSSSDSSSDTSSSDSSSDTSSSDSSSSDSSSSDTGNSID